MAQKETKQKIKKFAGIEIPPDLTKGNFFFLYFNTMLIGIFMTVPAIVQPAFLKDVVKISQDFAGSINGLLQNMSQIATLALVAVVGVLSDKVGRKILAIIGFIIVAIFFFLLTLSNDIGSALHLISSGIFPAKISSHICALLSFAPSRAAEFTAYSPGLLTTYVIRLIIGIGLVFAYPQFITMVVDYTYDKDRGKGMAMNGVMMGIASIVVFGLFAQIQKKTDVITLIYIVSLVSMLGALCTGIFLKDRMPEMKTKKPGLKDIIPVVRKSLPLKASYLCSLITRVDIVVLATFLVSWGVKHGHQIQMASNVATMKAALPMIVMSVASLVVFPVIGVLLDKWGRVPTIILALFSAALGMFLLAIVPDPFSGLVYVGVIFISIGMAGSIAGANTLASDVSPKGMLGSVLGGLNTMQPIGMLFFMAIGGYLFDKFSPGWAFGVKGMASLLLGIWMFFVRDSIKSEADKITSFDNLKFTMKWEEEAKKLLLKVPGPFREVAVSGTEDYAREHSYEKITPSVMEEFKKELGM
jgi:MFS family permease